MQNFTLTVVILNCLLICNFFMAYGQAAGVKTAVVNDPNTKIDPALIKQLDGNNGAKATMLVEMVGGTQKVIDDFATRRYASSEAYQTAYSAALDELAKTSQKNVLAFLQNEKAKPNRADLTYESISLTNIIIVRKGDLQLAKDLAKFDEISKIIADGQVVGF